MLLFRSSAKHRLHGRDPNSGAGRSTSIIKPLCGAEKNLHANLMSAVRQDYGPFEVIFALHSARDQALGAAMRVRQECPHADIYIVVDERRIGANGKISNLHNALEHAGGEIIVISDSDMHLRPDFLRRITAPFSDPSVGIVCTLYRARQPDNIFASLEMLSLNADFTPSMIFAFLTRASVVCPGASMAIRRDVLDAIGGLLPMRDHFVEDYELGRRVAAEGYRVVLIPYAAEMEIEVPDCAAWWRRQVAWDQKTRSIKPWGFLFHLLLRGVPISLIYALSGGVFGWGILSITTAARIATGAVNTWLLGDKEGCRRIWLLPARDVLSILVWAATLLRRKTGWRGRTFWLRKGKLITVR